MADPGPQTKVDPEELFLIYYNAGERRSYQQVAAITKERGIPDENGLAYITIRRYADDFDWDERANALDEEARRIADKRLASMIAKQRVRHIEFLSVIGTKFGRRLMPSTAENPNPAAILPGDIGIGDFIQVAKEFDRMVGAADRGLNEDEQRVALDDMEKAILEMDLREQAAIAAAGSTSDTAEVDTTTEVAE